MVGKSRINWLFLNETGKPCRGSLDLGAPRINTQLALISDPVTDFWELGQAVLPSALPVGHRRCCPLSGLFCRGEPRPPLSPPLLILGSVPLPAVSCFVLFLPCDYQLFIGQWPFRFHVRWSVVITPDEIYIVPYLTRDQSTFTDTILLIFHTWL